MNFLETGGFALEDPSDTFPQSAYSESAWVSVGIPFGVRVQRPGTLFDGRSELWYGAGPHWGGSVSTHGGRVNT